MATTTELEARIKELEERLRQMDEDRLSIRGRALVGELFPPESRKHMREAWKHNLMAVRSALDHWIEKQDDNGSTGGTKRRESISVE
jgi:phenylacetate-coenzyme A ligase PaaK-like adenylate-forming protein